MAVSFLRFQFPCLPNVHCVFQKRSPGGDLAGNISLKAGERIETLQTREELLKSLRPYGLESWSECHQVHGDKVIADPAPVGIDCNVDALPLADGMMTNRKGLGLLIKTADCQPILLANRGGTHVMGIHSGWRGNRMDLPCKAVKIFCGAYNLRPEDIFAVRGPSLGPSAAEFVNFDQEWGEAWKKWYCEKTKCLDLWAIARHQLRSAGVPDSQIYELDICTWLNSEEFFSWRHDASRGRQGSLIWISA